MVVRSIIFYIACLPAAVFGVGRMITFLLNNNFCSRPFKTVERRSQLATGEKHRKMDERINDDK